MKRLTAFPHCFQLTVLLFFCASATGMALERVTSNTEQELEARVAERRPAAVMCERRPKEALAGYDLSRTARFVDVGQCGGRCVTGVAPDQMHVVPNDLLRSPQYGDELESGATETSLCLGAERVCRPYRSRRTQVHLVGGEATLQVVDECVHEAAAGGCRRVPHTVLYYPNSPHETPVDVGFCLGSCAASSTLCKPFENRTVVIQGPNGAEAVTTVATCRCSAPCYRVPHRVAVYQRADNRTELTELDVGRCVGECAAVEKCVMRSKTNPELCLASLQMGGACVPLEYRRHWLHLGAQPAEPLLEITKCGCR